MNLTDFILKTIGEFCRTLLKYNSTTGEAYVYKYDGTFYSDPEEAHVGRELLHDVLNQDLIHPDDVWKFELLMNPEPWIRQFLLDKNSSILMYRRMQEGKYIWVRIRIALPENYSKDSPYALFYSHDVTESEASFYDSFSVLSQSLHKMLKVNLTQDTFSTIKEYLYEECLHRAKDFRYSEYVERFIKEGFVHSEDIATFRTHTNKKLIGQHFKEGNSSFTYFYRRRVGDLFRWVRLMILPAPDYSDENQTFFFYVEDVHKDILKLLDGNSANIYAKYFQSANTNLSEGYYENLLDVLSTFTHPYIDFYMINLERDLYIKYKIRSGSLNEDIPYVGSYSQASEKTINKLFTGKQREEMLSYATSEKLQKLLKDVMSLEYRFTLPDGRTLKTTCRKIESVNGTPTKAICHTELCTDEHLLQIKAFGNFEVFHPDGTPVKFTRKQSKQLLAYLVDKQGYPVTSKDIVCDILEKPSDDIKAIKYVSTLVRRAITDLENAGFPDVIIKEHKTLRLDTSKVDCDYYHLVNGDSSYWKYYHNEYMKEYSWAEETNAEILVMANR